MNLNDKQALNEFLRGVAGGVGVVALFILILVACGTTAEKTPTSNFTVIDQYKGCDVVQWHYNILSDYKYFLHCPK